MAQCSGLMVLGLPAVWEVLVLNPSVYSESHLNNATLANGCKPLIQCLGQGPQTCGSQRLICHQQS